jgi:hypothetical protein
MFKRNQLEEAIALVYEPGLAESSSEIRTQLKRLLENRSEPWPQQAFPAIPREQTSPSTAWIRLAEELRIVFLSKFKHAF